MSNSNKRKKIIKTTAVIVVICVIGGAVYFKYSEANDAKAKAAISMAATSGTQIEPVSRKDVSSMISATGNVEAEKIYSISLSTLQEISKVLVDVGDEVKEGQTLIEYDYLSSKEKLDKNLKDANISLKNAQLSLQTFNIPATEDEIAGFKNAIVVAEKAIYQSKLDLKENANKIEDAKKSIEDTQKDIEDAKIDLDNAQRDIDNAQRDLDSNKQLYEIGAISQQDYEKAQTTYDDKVKAYNDIVKAQDSKTTAHENAVRTLADLQSQTQTYEYNITTAEYNLEKANNDLKKGQTPTMDKETKIKYEQQQLQIQSNQIKIEDIQSEINDLTDVSTSPINGVIIEKNVEDGDVAKESTALLKLADVTKLKVSAKVSEFDASNIKLGQPVTMISDGIRDKIYTGKIIFIDPQAKEDTQGGTAETGVSIGISIENSDESLKPGFSIDVEIVTGDSKDILSVPITSILSDAQKQKYVFTVTPENTLKKSIIKTGVYGDMYVEVKEGLSENENVVSSPDSSMKEGDVITVAKPMPTGGEGGTENGTIQSGGTTSEATPIQ